MSTWDKADESDVLLQTIRKGVEHDKTCQTCSRHHVCDERAEINAKQMEAAIFGQMS